MSGEFDFAKELVGREFVHFKGGHYQLHAIATDSETREGRTFPRFRLLEES